VWPFCYQFADVLRPQPRPSVPNIDAPGRTVSAIVESRNLDLKIVATLQERFAEAITTEQELRNIVGPANRWLIADVRTLSPRRRLSWWVQSIRRAWLICHQREIARDS
jgi:hypothetical protein